MNSGHFELFRLGGVPVVADASLPLMVLLFGQGYWFSGRSDIITLGIVVIAGLIASVLLHEYFHSLAAGYYRVPTSHIELGALGGLCVYARSLPAGVMPRVVVSLAGPFANLILWQALTRAAEPVMEAGQIPLGHALNVIGWWNYALMWFNLLPSFPLDGGKALEGLLGGVLLGRTATIIVGWLGMGIVALLVAWTLRSGLGGIQDGLWQLMIALLLFASNRDRLEQMGAPPFGR